MSLQSSIKILGQVSIQISLDKYSFVRELKSSYDFVHDSTLELEDEPLTCSPGRVDGFFDSSGGLEFEEKRFVKLKFQKSGNGSFQMPFQRF